MTNRQFPVTVWPCLASVSSCSWTSEPVGWTDWRSQHILLICFIQYSVSFVNQSGMQKTKDTKPFSFKVALMQEKHFWVVFFFFLVNCFFFLMIPVVREREWEMYFVKVGLSLTKQLFLQADKDAPLISLIRLNSSQQRLKGPRSSPAVCALRVCSSDMAKLAHWQNMIIA